VHQQRLSKGEELEGIAGIGHEQGTHVLLIRGGARIAGMKHTEGATSQQRRRSGGRAGDAREAGTEQWLNDVMEELGGGKHDGRGELETGIHGMTTNVNHKLGGDDAGELGSDAGDLGTEGGDSGGSSEGHGEQVTTVTLSECPCTPQEGITVTKVLVLTGDALKEETSRREKKLADRSRRFLVDFSSVSRRFLVGGRVG
jgi:hypothetical protein